MKFILFTDKKKVDSILENGIQINDCYRGKGILVYPEIDIQFRAPNSESEFINKEKELNKMSIYEKWEVIGALGLKQSGKSICALKVELTDKHWPIKVFIDIRHQIAKEFGKLLDKNELLGVQYSTGDKLSEVIQKIESERFVLESSFIVNGEKNLKLLIEMFLKSRGGVWGAHSLDCMVDCDIPANSIEETITYKKTRNTMWKSIKRIYTNRYLQAEKWNRKSINFYQLKASKTYFDYTTLGIELIQAGKKQIWDDIRKNLIVDY